MGKHRLTRGEALVGGLNVPASQLKIADTAITATATELNAVADVSVNGAILKVQKIAISATPTGSEQDTTIDLPAKAVLLDVYLDVTTAEATGATKTMHVGLKAAESGGDADGFLKAVSCAATGMKQGVATLTAGGSETYFASTTRGALLATLVAGSDSAGDVGTYYEFPHLTGSVTAKSVVYTAGSGDWAEFRGAIYLVYVELG